MNIGKALLLIASRYNLTKYRLAQVSGVSASAIGKAMNGKQESLAWDDVEKLANGLAKIDPLAIGAFYYALSQPEQFFYMAGMPPQPEIMEQEKSENPEIMEREKPENIDEVMATLLKLGIVTPSQLEKYAKGIPKYRNGTPAMSLAEWISVNMQWARLGTDTDEEQNDE
ncbi:hypothetical protein GlitD10_0995 [Gloeomargarita lithophora Alchichica-D10]|uniref:Uncharacterized protein n=1 Tax=Gloeomargarita lithophora Alchichica-D10 TaxID=1188229 RepID=A0A1J0ABN8_9CYAN|nr:helix-turn-helix domain-containing protein [Gloeomargarita lithophora]APB33313.1 hypothetical protein GlitD10_0995 [Gloeomargarita lithophora Alchichica-D10]